jgi:hypothetical protein
LGPRLRATDFISAVIISQGPWHDVWMKATNTGLPFNDESAIALPFWSVRLTFGNPSAGLTAACEPALPSSARATASGSASTNSIADATQAVDMARRLRLAVLFESTSIAGLAVSWHKKRRAIYRFRLALSVAM